jgi:hypothetical protein
MRSPCVKHMYSDSNGILYDLYALRTGVRPSGVHVVYCLPMNLPVLCERPHIPLALVLGSSNSLSMPFAVSTHILEDMILSVSIYSLRVPYEDAFEFGVHKH